jgi:trans-aconitate methyltransferase|tara:strand:- start:83 stop:787 length:705 start_codon:yes stop_codon:yes gene_type:complete
MNYPGLELENFDKATIWRKYIYLLIKKYINNNILEVGSGIGSFTKNYKKKIKNITLSEIDSSNYNLLLKKFEDKKNIKIISSFIGEIKNNFNTILYLNVLEHIEKDVDEINEALKKIENNGYLVILVPAHNRLYSKFDKAIGHIRRYEINFFRSLKLENSKIVDLYYLDSMGYFLYLLNRIFFKEEIYPSKLKIFLWDKLFTPISIILDRFLNYKFGKNIMCIIKKSKNYHTDV